MMPARRRDPLPWLLALSALLMLCSITLLGVRSHAQPAPRANTIADAPVGNDGDGDELLEHWGDPRYSHEERVQLAGLLVVFGIAGGAAYRRRLRLRRFYDHAPV